MLDTIHVYVELAGAAVVLWRANRFVTRLETLLKDFPPHRHEGKRIIYASDFQPTRSQQLRLDSE